MKEFYFLKPDSRDKAVLWDVFEMDSLEIESAPDLIKLEQIDAILEELKHNIHATKAELSALLTSCIFQNIGGTSKTPVKEVLAFSYALHIAPNLRFEQFLASLEAAISMSNAFAYFEACDITVPMQYVNIAHSLIKDSRTSNLIADKYDFVVDTEVSVENFVTFQNDVVESIISYNEGAHATKKAMENM